MQHRTTQTTTITLLCLLMMSTTQSDKVVVIQSPVIVINQWLNVMHLQLICCVPHTMTVEIMQARLTQIMISVLDVHGLLCPCIG